MKEIEEIDDDREEINVACLYEERGTSKECTHATFNLCTLATCNGHTLCTLIDSGAQVSLISQSMWKRVTNGEANLNATTSTLRGITGQKTNFLGTADLRITFGNGEELESFPFAIVRDEMLPCCLLVGLNFLKHFMAKVKLKTGKLIIQESESGLEVLIAMRSLRLMNAEDGEERDREVKVKFQIDEESLAKMQDSNHGVSQLKRVVRRSIPPSQWKIPALNQFRRHASKLALSDQVLVKHTEEKAMAVTTFPFMVEIIHKIHSQVAHLGRHKVLDIVQKQFWHPAADLIAREICRCCHYCQLNKINVQQQKPPIRKVNPIRPFELVAMDLVALPMSGRGHIVAFVIVDLFSKWAMAIPIKKKTASVVSRVLRDQVIPAMLRKPETILSDNGPEFRGVETEQTLAEFNITHVYSSPYCPSSNGGVERLNRTLIGMIKALSETVSDWDEALGKAVHTYNNTYHSQLKAAPSECLLKTAHEVNEQVPVERSVVEYWREGNPNFKPFHLHQKVIKEIHRVGNLSAYKLMPKYDGPYTITKVQSNGVSYELTKDDDQQQKVYRSHYKKLRANCSLPYSIKRYIPDGECLLVMESAGDTSDSKMRSPTGLLTDSSDEEFMEFNLEQYRSAEAQRPTTPSPVPEGKKNNSRLKRGNKKKVSKPLSELQCTEIVVEGEVQSTPKGNSLVPFSEFMSADISVILEQVWTVQEELNEEAENILSNIEESLTTEKGTLDKTLSQVPVKDISIHDNGNDSRDFIGFSRADRTEFAAKLEEIRAIVRTSRANIRESQNSSLIRRYTLHSGRSFASPQQPSPRLTRITEELCDFVPEMRCAESPITRRLRSQGSLPDTPWVQSSTLERRSRSRFH